MKSKVNSFYTVDENNWVVSLVRKSDHALIVFETVGFEADDEGLCIRWFDFMPHERVGGAYDPYAYGNNYASFFAALKNEQKPGRVRFCPRKKGDPQQQPLINVSESTTKKELFASLGWNEDTDSWLKSKDAIQKIIDSARVDFNIDPESDKHLIFQLSGGSVGKNCITWCWSKLKAAGINAEHDNLQNKVAIRPENNIGNGKNNWPCVTM